MELMDDFLMNGFHALQWNYYLRAYDDHDKINEKNMRNNYWNAWEMIEKCA